MNCERRLGKKGPLLFIGGRGSDHNTAERIRGFRAAHADLGLTVEEDHILACGYAPEKAEKALDDLAAKGRAGVGGMFVNSTISLEGVMRWVRKSGHLNDDSLVLGCFDWDPFVSLLGNEIEMVRQDVPEMLKKVFEIIESGASKPGIIQVPPMIPERA